ncbi:MAG: spore germination protein, partial [Clostridia bacterium]|nr:spore germination protein [Clostridia bacterium]
MKIDEITNALKETFCNSDDLKCREITVAGKRCLFSYIDGGTDKLLLEQNVILPLSKATSLEPPYLDSLTETVLYSEEITVLPLSNSAGAIADGDVAFLIEDDDSAYIFSLRKPEKRSVTEPPTASVLKGPREGFIEELKTNLSLIRRRLKTPDLAVKFFQVGRYSTTT